GVSLLRHGAPAPTTVQQAPQPAAAPAVAAEKPPPVQAPAPSPPPAPTPTQKARPTEPPRQPEPAEPERVDAISRAARPRDIAVTVRNARVDFVTGKDFGDFTSKEKHLLIDLEIANGSSSHKVDYHGWAGSPLGFEKGPTLTDNFGNRYKAVHFG